MSNEYCENKHQDQNLTDWKFPGHQTSF